LLESINRGLINESSKWVSEEALNLLTQMLEPKPEKRISIEKILTDSWVSSATNAEEDKSLPKTLERLKEFRAENKL